MWKNPRAAIAATVAGLMLGACGLPWQEQGSGTKVTQVRELTGFKAVHNDTRLDVRVRVGEAEHVEVLVDDNLQDFVKVELVGEELWVRTPEPINYWGEGRVDITLPRLTAASNAGSGEMDVDGRQTPEDLKVSGTGSGRLSLCTDASGMEAFHSGSGVMVLCQPEGTAPLTHLTFAGSGSGDVSWTGEVGEAHIQHGGSGKLTLTGRGETLTILKTGSGKGEARGFVVTDADISSSGSGSLEVTVEGAATVLLSGSGDVELWGGGAVEVVADTGSGRIVTH